MNLFEQILQSRGLNEHTRESFLKPDYDTKHNPFLLPDMQKATMRILQAKKENEKITIYGDYDIDGITATTLLLDAFSRFGFKDVRHFIPNRFIDGYGLSTDAIEQIASDGTRIIITVDCGSISHKEIERARELGVDVIVTDHHNVADIQPKAVAVINPKRLLKEYPEEYSDYILKSGSKMQGKIYPFLDLAGVGVAFKLVQALQTKLEGLPNGQEKWLLDLVALGTVCDVVNITDENRIYVYWGLKVIAKTRRQGLRALMEVSGVTPENVSSRALGFTLGPRMNAAGRLDTAQYSVDLLTSLDSNKARRLAQKLDVLNTSRRKQQDLIFYQAIDQADEYSTQKVLVLSHKDWSHGIIGVVASKIMEAYKKPVFILQEMGDESKGSARSYGDFSVADAVRSAERLITKGGGHKFAAGVTLPTKNIDAFRRAVNEFYEKKRLENQEAILLPRADIVAPISSLSLELCTNIAILEPFGNGNPEPIFSSQNLRVTRKRIMGKDGQHVKLDLQDIDGFTLSVIAFNAPKNFFVESGERVTVWYRISVNEWQGRRDVEGQLLRIERA